MTNFEKIKSMSVEEMARLFIKYSDCPPIKTCRGVSDCLGCWINWLNEEAGE